MARWLWPGPRLFVLKPVVQVDGSAKMGKSFFLPSSLEGHLSFHHFLCNGEDIPCGVVEEHPAIGHLRISRGEIRHADWASS